MENHSLILQELQQAAGVLDTFISNPENLARIDMASQLIADSFGQGGKVISCGNGGSHCDAMHFAEELTGRFRDHRAAPDRGEGADRYDLRHAAAHARISRRLNWPRALLQGLVDLLEFRVSGAEPLHRSRVQRRLDRIEQIVQVGRLIVDIEHARHHFALGIALPQRA